MFLSIILPTYNERSNLPILCHLLVQELSQPSCPIDRFELIIVDDNSPDGTGAVAEKLAKIYGPDLIQVTAKIIIQGRFAHDPESWDWEAHTCMDYNMRAGNGSS